MWRKVIHALELALIAALLLLALLTRFAKK